MKSARMTAGFSTHAHALTAHSLTMATGYTWKILRVHTNTTNHKKECKTIWFPVPLIMVWGVCMICTLPILTWNLTLDNYVIRTKLEEWNISNTKPVTFQYKKNSNLAFENILWKGVWKQAYTDVLVTFSKLFYFYNSSLLS